MEPQKYINTSKNLFIVIYIHFGQNVHIRHIYKAELSGTSLLSLIIQAGTILKISYLDHLLLYLIRPEIYT